MTAKNVMVLGVDCPIVTKLQKWVMEGKLPTIKRLMDEGVFASNCLVPFPTITPPNWTTIATGAWPGTHGVTDYWSHTPGTPLDETPKAFDGSKVLSERIWTAAERMGKKSIIVNYPVSWPPTISDGYQIAGYGLNVNDWRIGAPVGVPHFDNIAHDILLSAEPYPFGTDVEFTKARGWEGVKHSPKALEAEVTLSLRRTLTKMEPVVWYILVDDVEGRGYDTVLISRSKKKVDIFAHLRVGEWTPNIYDTFQTEKGPKEGVFRCKLLELSRDASQFRLYVPGICSLHGWAVPDTLEEEIRSKDGLPMGRPGWESFLAEWIDGETLVETQDLHHAWIADASLYLLRNKPWDLFFLHIHTTDWIYHTFSLDLDPSTAPDPAKIPEFEELELRMYQGVDRALGRILEAANDETLILVVSDHGARTTGYDFNVDDILDSAGLIAYVPAKEGERAKIDWNADTTRKEGHGQGKGPVRIDWSRTKAVGQRSIYVYVNLKGRDPEGIVEPGEEYEHVRDQIIKALFEYVDPRTGIKPIVLALRREDARLLGLYGDRVGDVVFALDRRFGKEEHGAYLPTTRHGISDLRGLFIMAGPGVKRGATIERTVSLTDVVPTLCYLAEVPVPQDCQGNILYQALDDPDIKLKELIALRERVAELRQKVERGHKF